MHGISGRNMDRIKSELEMRKVSHKDYLRNLELNKSFEGVAAKLERKFNYFRRQKSRVKQILEKFKKI